MKLKNLDYRIINYIRVDGSPSNIHYYYYGIENRPPGNSNATCKIILYGGCEFKYVELNRQKEKI